MISPLFPPCLPVPSPSPALDSAAADPRAAERLLRAHANGERRGAGHQEVHRGRRPSEPVDRRRCRRQAVGRAMHLVSISFFFHRRRGRSQEKEGKREDIAVLVWEGAVAVLASLDLASSSVPVLCCGGAACCLACSSSAGSPCSRRSPRPSPSPPSSYVHTQTQTPSTQSNCLGDYPVKVSLCGPRTMDHIPMPAHHAPIRALVLS